MTSRTATTPARFALQEIDDRAGERRTDLPLLSVTIDSGVVPRDQSGSSQAASEDVSHYKVCREGDIVINRMRAFQGAIGRSPTDGLVSPDYAVMRPTDVLDSRFAHYQMRSDWFVAEITKRLRGIGDPNAAQVRTPRINVSDLGRIDVHTPSLPEQRRVADVLDAETARIDRLVNKNRQVIEWLDLRDTRLTFDKVHGVDAPNLVPTELPWCPSLPAHWETVPVYLIAEHDYGYPFPSDGFTDTEAGVPVIRIRDVVPNRVATWFSGPDEVPDEHWIKDGDIVIGMDGLFNHVRWQGGLAAMNQRVCTYRPREGAELTTEYLGLALRFPLKHINDTVYSTTVKHLSFADLDSQKIPVPPRHEQNEIVDEVRTARARNEDLRSKVERQIHLLETRRRSLITAAVTGQTTV